MTDQPVTVTKDEQIVLITKVEGAGICRVCGRQVTWGRTIAGRPMPLEQELRVRALLQPSMQARRPVRVAFCKGTRETIIAKDAKHEAKLVAAGFAIREELYAVWEIPASLTHWANCTAAAADRKDRRR